MDISSRSEKQSPCGSVEYSEKVITFKNTSCSIEVTKLLSNLISANSFLLSLKAWPLMWGRIE